MIKKAVSVVILVMVATSALLLPFAGIERSNRPPSIESALFFPSRYPKGNWSPHDLKFEDVYFRSQDQTRLHGWYLRSSRSRLCIMILHGNAGNLTTRERLLRHLQKSTSYNVFVFDYRGFGRSEGKATIEGVVDDSQAAYQALKDLAQVSDGEIVLIGESLGGALAVDLASEFVPRGLVLQSTFSSLRDVAEFHFPQYALTIPRSKLNSVERIGLYDGPIFQSHGTNDRAIPLTLGRRLFDAASGSKQFLELAGADHNNWLDENYLQELDTFLSRLEEEPSRP